MPLTFKQRAWKMGKWLGALFLVLFAFRLLYGYYAADASYSDGYNSFFDNVDNLKRNYASQKIDNGRSAPMQAHIDNSQKYEKTATVKSKTSQFEKDEPAIRNTTRQFNAIIQYEQNQGNKGSRELHLVIGVSPASFDSFYQVIQSIALVKATAIAKVDKTNEYRKLNAKKASLEKTLSSLNELKTRSGQIGDYVSLHDKILEIETQLQELGVELGDFDTENEFCTVRFSLYEGAAEKKISLLSRVKIALEWTIKYYTILIISLLAVSCLCLVLLLLVEKLNILKSVARKLSE